MAIEHSIGDVNVCLIVQRPACHSSRVVVQSGLDCVELVLTPPVQVQSNQFSQMKLSKHNNVDCFDASWKMECSSVYVDPAFKNVLRFLLLRFVFLCHFYVEATHVKSIASNRRGERRISNKYEGTCFHVLTAWLSENRSFSAPELKTRLGAPST